MPLVLQDAVRPSAQARAVSCNAGLRCSALRWDVGGGWGAAHEHRDGGEGEGGGERGGGRGLGARESGHFWWGPGTGSSDCCPQVTWNLQVPLQRLGIHMYTYMNLYYRHMYLYKYSA